MGILSSLGKVASKIANVGQNLALALLGQYTSTPLKKPKTGANVDPIDFDSIEKSTQVLGLIYGVLVRARDEELAERAQLEIDQKKQKNLDDDRNDELIKALTVRRKPKKKPRKKPPEEKKEEPKKPPVKPGEKPPVKPPAEKAPVKGAPKPPKTSAKEVKPEAPKAPEKIPTKEVSKPSTIKISPGVSGTKGLIISALVAAGYSKTAQANVLANVEEESGFVPQTETVNKYTADNLFKLYGPVNAKFTGRMGSAKGKEQIANPPNARTGKANKVRFQSLEDADALIAKGPEAVAEIIYGGRMGNNSPGDGWKYRGRGFIQITGKENYEKVGKLIGEDLVGNPELANDPVIAAKIIPAYFKVHDKKPQDLEDIETAISTVGTGSKSSEDLRRNLSKKYQQEDLSVYTGSQIDQISKENKDMKSALDVKNQTNVNNTNITTSQNAPKQVIQEEQIDDRPPIYKKQ